MLVRPRRLAQGQGELAAEATSLARPRSFAGERGETAANASLQGALSPRSFRRAQAEALAETGLRALEFAGRRPPPESWPNRKKGARLAQHNGQNPPKAPTSSNAGQAQICDTAESKNPKLDL